MQVLFALARGAHVVTAEWVFASIEAGHFVSEQTYYPTRYRAVLTTGRESRAYGVLWGKSVCVNGVRDPSRVVLQQLVRCAGGVVASSASRATIFLTDNAHAVEGRSRKGEQGPRLVVSPSWLYDTIECAKQQQQRTGLVAVGGGDAPGASPAAIAAIVGVAGAEEPSSPGW